MSKIHRRRVKLIFFLVCCSFCCEFFHLSITPIISSFTSSGKSHILITSTVILTLLGFPFGWLFSFSLFSFENECFNTFGKIGSTEQFTKWSSKKEEFSSGQSWLSAIYQKIRITSSFKRPSPPGSSSSSGTGHLFIVASVREIGHSKKVKVKRSDMSYLFLPHPPQFSDIF